MQMPKTSVFYFEQLTFIELVVSLYKRRGGLPGFRHLQTGRNRAPTNTIGNRYVDLDVAEYSQVRRATPRRAGLREIHRSSRALSN
jgi:hypothetical protein